jgi:2-polyprenyl-3-methyl-5-hydroxy-6-metoxy-1,4-benzoquinol methylase
MVQDLAGEAHWDKRKGGAKPRLPSRLNAYVGDMIALLDPLVVPGSRVLDVGCSPGKFLLWCALAKQAQACGVEYAPNSHKATVELFKAADVAADIRPDDFMQTTFEPGSFDVVYSFGVIEHFDDPRPMVKQHFDMLKPGGTAIIMVPHFGAESIYGWLAQRMDKSNYDIHNVNIMSESAMLALAPEGSQARAYKYGRLAPWPLPWGKFPRAVELLACYGLNGLALLQPVEIEALCPWLILEIKRPIHTQSVPRLDK